MATLSRPDSYYRELTVETLWSDGSYASTVQYWEDGGWSHTRQTLASGAVRHDLIGPETSYYWYEGSSVWHAFPSDQRSSDLAQHIPTYETVLELDASSITGTGYEVKGSFPCVYVEVQGESGTLERYWISTDNGLLISAEREINGAPGLPHDRLYSGPDSLSRHGLLCPARRAGAALHRMMHGGGLPPPYSFLPWWSAAVRLLRLVPQAQNEHQPQGDHQLQVVPLPQQEQDDEQEQQIPAVQVLQLQRFQQTAQAPAPTLSRQEEAREKGPCPPRSGRRPLPRLGGSCPARPSGPRLLLLALEVLDWGPPGSSTGIRV